MNFDFFSSHIMGSFQSVFSGILFHVFRDSQIFVVDILYGLGSSKLNG
jgi:hypothetical protein